MPGLKDLGNAILANVEAEFAAAGIELPALRYVAPGPFQTVAFDCDQVTVAIDAVNRGEPGTPTSGYVLLSPFSAQITVAVVRMCMPVSDDETAPTAEEQAAASDITLADLQRAVATRQTHPQRRRLHPPRTHDR